MLRSKAWTGTGWTIALLVATACGGGGSSGDDDDAAAGAAGMTASGSGGATGSGGEAASSTGGGDAGTTASGGDTGNAGTPGAAGTPGGSGGAGVSGGPGAGGAPGSGGVDDSGGSAGAGDTSGSGGDAGSAGTAGSGNASGDGGNPGGGGQLPTGGSAGVAGTPAGGGRAGSGGAVSAGGQTATGGDGGAGGAPTPPAPCGGPLPTGPTHYVATDGSDDPSAGTEQNPWASISYALQNVPDGSVIVVAPGEYHGRVQLRGTFAQGVVVVSEVPYQARLRNDATVVTCYYGQGITLEGFDIAHDGAGAEALVVQIQNLRDASEGRVGRIVLRNNVLHDSYNNDILKVNNGAELVTIERNMFYNQTGSDEHIDINSVTDVVVRDNVFFNDFEGSGRTNANDTSSFVVIKDSNSDTDGILGSDRITVRRNVMFNWQGNTGTSFILVGEDGTANFEATNVLIENNLLLGNSANDLRAAFGVKGGQNVTFRSNTVVGDLPSNAFAFRLNVEGSNPANENIAFFNNVWSDPTGTMNDFTDTPPGETASFTLLHNVYYNGGSAIPVDATDAINVADDAEAIEGDPVLASQAGLVLPRWNPANGAFADGSASICEVHVSYATAYGTPGTGSVAIDAALASECPADDLLGQSRGSSPDVGAVEAP